MVDGRFAASRLRRSAGGFRSCADSHDRSETGWTLALLAAVERIRVEPLAVESAHPVETGAQPNNLANDDNRRSFAADGGGNGIAQCRGQHLLSGRGRSTDDRDRLIGSAAPGNQPVDNIWQMLQRHVQHEDRRTACDRAPIEPVGNGRRRYCGR